MKQMRQKINQTDEISRLDDQKGRENLKNMKQDDYDKYMETKRLAIEGGKQADREYVNRRVAMDNAKMQTEYEKREVSINLT